MSETTKLEMSKQFSDLVFFALDHGIRSVEDGAGPLIPFVVFEGGSERKLQRFVAQQLEQSLAQARAAVEKFSLDVQAYAIAHDGFVTVNGERFDAILVEASERGRRGVVLGQRYRPKTAAQSFQRIGNAAFLGDCETPLR